MYTFPLISQDMQLEANVVNKGWEPKATSLALHT